MNNRSQSIALVLSALAGAASESAQGEPQTEAKAEAKAEPLTTPNKVQTSAGRKNPGLFIGPPRVDTAGRLMIRVFNRNEECFTLPNLDGTTRRTDAINYVSTKPVSNVSVPGYVGDRLNINAFIQARNAIHAQIAWTNDYSSKFASDIEALASRFGLVPADNQAPFTPGTRDRELISYMHQEGLGQ